MVALQDFLRILCAPRLKITNRSFWPSCERLVLLTGVRPKPGFGSFEVRSWVKFSKFWRGETLDLYANVPESFPPRFITHFGRPTAENNELVFLTIVRPISAFDRRATKTWVRSIWGATMGQILRPYSNLDWTSRIKVYRTYWLQDVIRNLG